MNDTSYIEPLSDSELTELLIRHMLHLPEVYQKAQQLKIEGSDMMIDNVYGNELYREIINIINSVGTVPISADSLFLGLKRRFDDSILDDNLKQSAFDLLSYFYDETRPLERPDFFDNKLAPLIKKRRAQKIIALYKDDIPTLTAELNKLSHLLNSDSESGRPRIVSPFKNLLFKTKNTLIGTGLENIDRRIGGLMLGEYGLLIGFSGGGKTALGTNIVGTRAEGGFPSMYISCEEHEEDLAQRFYSKAYRIPYNQLRQGSANIELEAKFNTDMADMKREKLANNLCLIGMKGVSDITTDYLYETLIQNYETTGFVPQLIMLDQMQFISPTTAIRKGGAIWETEKIVAAELDELSHKPIGGKNFVLWVQCQAKGKVKANFTREEIDGFKGIIHKPDLVLGVGREASSSSQIHIFSLKARHCSDFTLTLKTDFEYMTVTSTEISDKLTPPRNETENSSMTVVNTSPIPRN